MRKSELTVEGLGAYRAADKLAAAGVPVYFVREVQKNAVTLGVDGKDVKKVFAILRSSCYNVRKVRFRGLLWLRGRALRHAGLLMGAALFLAAVLFFESRVLAVRVVGSGAYYGADVREILSEGGAGILAPMPRETAPLAARILSLPRVSFCSLRRAGGVLTVTVEVSDELAPIEGTPLLSPAAGTVEELVVVRGQALVQCGDAVASGQKLVDCFRQTGGGTRPVLVIARVRIGSPFRTEYPGCTREEAQARLLLEYGEGAEASLSRTAQGWLAEGRAFFEASVNF